MLVRCVVLCCLLGGVAMAASETAPARVFFLLANPSLTRVGQLVEVTADVGNTGEDTAEITAELVLPIGVELRQGQVRQTLRLEARQEADLVWRVTASQSTYAVLKLVLAVGEVKVERAVPIRWLPVVAKPAQGVVPPPTPVKTPLLIGAHHCPLWEADKPQMWSQLLNHHPERVPALGFYDQASPEVSDWETKFAVDHGISYFIYCWYRSSQGGPVTQRFGSAIHEGLFKARHADQMKFTIMWENQSRGQAGVADEADLMNNLLPFWMENYFQHPSYLKVDNKPVLFIYRPEFLIQDLGGEAQVVAAFEKMRQACRAAGFDGLWLLGEYRGLDPKHLELMKRIGLDYTFAYVWGIRGNPTPEVAIETQLGYLQKTEELNILPQVPTVSQAWSGWHDEGSIWKIPPAEFETLLRRGKAFCESLPADQLGHRMMILDNWNEWGEGHYLAPYTEYGFGYVDAVRKVFAPNAGPHTDYLPEDAGVGPYDTAYWDWLTGEAQRRRQVTEKVTQPGGDAPGLVGWWTFDEAADSPVALDYTGHRLGGVLHDIVRQPGKSGQAVDCQGGSVLVPSDRSLSVTDAMTIECWVKTDQSGQRNNWLVNRIFSGGVTTGFRLGVLDDHPCFQIPITAWSHHLKGELALPRGRWVHLAGTFDGTTMRLYVDGRLSGTMERPGPVRPNDFNLCLGNYALDHVAHFVGLLDDVKLWNRALSADEIAQEAAR